MGITWDGSNVISADDVADRHYKHSGFSSTISDSYASPSSFPMGITWDGRFGVVEKYSSETGVGMESIIEQLASFIEAETGSGIDAEGERKAILIQTETGTGAEEEIVGLKDSEVGNGIGAISDLLGELEDSEVGSGIGAISDLLGELEDSEVGSGIGAISDLLGELEDSDLGVGIDSLRSLLAAIDDSDLGSGIETECVWVYLLLKLLQKKELNVLASQKEKKLKLKLSQSK